MQGQWIFKKANVGYILQSNPHYVENTGDTDLVFSGDVSRATTTRIYLCGMDGAYAAQTGGSASARWSSDDRCYSHPRGCHPAFIESLYVNNRSQSMDHRRGRRTHANRTRSRVCLERVPHPVDSGLRLDRITGDEGRLKLAILVLGFASFLGGLWMKRSGARVLWRFSPRFSTELEPSWRGYRITWPRSISHMV